MSYIENIDPEIYKAINNEKNRLADKIELIASENLTHPAILEAAGSILTNKYAEGYPGKRYYGGCEYVDDIESLAIERAKKLFRSDYVNVQPHSGSNANMGAFFAMLKPEDTILSMNLSEGGHLTHGSPVNFSGKLYNIVFYGVSKETELIDYDEVHRTAMEHKPSLILAGATAYSRKIDFKKFKEIADETNSILMVDMAHFAGLVAAGLYDSPVDYADIVTSTTHKTLRGPRGGFILSKSEYAEPIRKSVFPGMQGGPLMHIIAGKAICFKLAMTDEFRVYQKQVVANAARFAKSLSELGLRIVTGGTDTHLFLVDLSDKNITGKEFEKILDRVGITVNKNTIPYDKQSPFVTSGIRIGAPAVTTRGMKEKDMDSIAEFISDTLKHTDNDSMLDEISSKIKIFLKQFPIDNYVI